jgi:uncharacterized membrane protein YhaH (DUF805 family)
MLHAAGFLTAAELVSGLQILLDETQADLTLLPVLAAAMALIIGLIHLLLLTILEFGLQRFHPAKTRGWLILSILCLILLLFALDGAVTAITGTFEEMTSIDWATFFVIAVSGGLVWWSLLPPPPSHIAHLFE